ncbi:MAG: hypothetical protein JNG85_01610 [Spirochaetaceae bacterium]|nr:hypothetical protein [Spirochaetaceae bacterium]
MRTHTRKGALALPSLLALAAAGLAVLFAATPLAEGPARSARDAYLAALPRPPAPRELLAVGSGETEARALRAAELAGILALLDEFEATRVVVLTGGSAAASEAEATTALREELPRLVDREYAGIEENLRALFGAIRAGSIAPRDAERYVDALAVLVRKSGARLKGAAGLARSEAESLLEAEARTMGGVFAGLDLKSAPRGDARPAAGESPIAAQRLALPVAKDRGAFVDQGSLRGEPEPLLRGARGGGFVESRPEADGLPRGAAVLVEERGRRYLRAELAALADRLGNPALRLEEGALLFKAARMPGGPVRDLRLPLDETGRALLSWRRSGDPGAPRSLGREELLAEAEREARFAGLLEAMESGGLLLGEGGALPSRMRHAEELRAALREEAARSDAWGETPGAAGTKPTKLETEKRFAALKAAWREERRAVFAAAAAYFGSGADAAELAGIEAALAAPGLPDEEAAAMRSRAGELARAHAAARELLGAITPARARLAENLRASFVFLNAGAGASAGSAASADPAAVAACLVDETLNGRAPRPLPARVAPLLGLGLAFVAAAAPLLLGEAAALLLGLVLALAAFGASIVLYLAGAVYLAPLPLVLGPSAAALAALAARPRARRGAVGEAPWPGVVAPSESATRPGGATPPIGAAPSESAAAPKGAAKAYPEEAETRAEKRPAAIAAFRAAGLARAAEELEPATARRLADAFALLVRAAVEAEGGRLAPGRGSVLIASFEPDAAKPGPNPPEGRAIQAARRAVERARLDAGPNGASALALGVGIDAGTCLLAAEDGGAGGEPLGAAVDLALRLADLNAHYKTTILATGAALAAAGAEAKAGARRLGGIKVEATGREAEVFSLDQPPMAR